MSKSIPNYFAHKFYGKFGNDHFSPEVKPGDIAYIRLRTFKPTKLGINREYTDDDVGYRDRKVEVKFIEKLPFTRYDKFIIYLFSQHVYLEIGCNGNEGNFKVQGVLPKQYGFTHGNLPINHAIHKFYADEVGEKLKV